MRRLPLEPLGAKEVQDALHSFLALHLPLCWYPKLSILWHWLWPGQESAMGCESFGDVLDLTCFPAVSGQVPLPLFGDISIPPYL